MDIIRQIEISDAEELRKLYGSVVDENLPYILRNSIPSVEEEKSFIQSVEESGGTIIVSEGADGCLIGMLTINRMLHSQLNHRASFGVSVANIHRGQGIGTRLIQRAMAWCKENGVTQLSLEVLSSNPAITLYERLGFSNIGENNMGIKVDDEYHPVLTMAVAIWP